MKQVQAKPATKHSTARRRIRGALWLAVQFLAPLVLFYGLRAAGVSAYATLVAGAALSVAGTAVDLGRRRTARELSLYVITIMVFSTVVSLLAGDERFLLARGAWVTGLSGLWFITASFTRRPLAYLLSRPLLEDRFGWPADWDTLWRRLPRFRRIWRMSGIILGTSLLLDCSLRILMAYSLPVDSVPALSTALSAATTVASLAAVNIYYQATGAARKWSRFYAGAGVIPTARFDQQGQGI